MKHLLNLLKSDNMTVRLIFFFIGLFIATFNYNLIFVSNHIVIGGVGGIAIIVQELTGLSTTFFINISNFILIFVSLIFLGKKKTMLQLFGCISYPLMVTITAPLAKMVNINFESTLLSLLVASVVSGIASGIIYRAGFSTGGTDVIFYILTDKIKKPITYISPIINNAIIICGGIVFSPVMVMYAMMIIFISNKITNIILFGISTNKMVYVISKKSKDIEDYIMNIIHTGATEMHVHSGLLEKKKQMLFCVVHNSQYHKFKDNILAMDPEAFILSNNCYEVKGGRKYNVLPF